MDRRLTKFREHARARANSAAPYSDEARAVAVACAQEQLEDGESTASVAQTLGVAPMTLDLWLPRSESRPNAKPDPKAWPHLSCHLLCPLGLFLSRAVPCPCPALSSKRAEAVYCLPQSIQGGLTGRCPASI